MIPQCQLPTVIPIGMRNEESLVGVSPCSRRIAKLSPVRSSLFCVSFLLSVPSVQMSCPALPAHSSPAA